MHGERKEVAIVNNNINHLNEEKNATQWKCKVNERAESKKWRNIKPNNNLNV